MIAMTAVVFRKTPCPQTKSKQTNTATVTICIVVVMTIIIIDGSSSVGMFNLRVITCSASS